MISSVFKNGRDINENKWLVTLTANQESLGIDIFHHALLVVEAWLNAKQVAQLLEIERKYITDCQATSPPLVFDYQPGFFLAEYEVVVKDHSVLDIVTAQIKRADDIPMTIICKEYHEAPFYRQILYPKWRHYPHWLPPEAVIAMIASIKQEAAAKPLPYRLFGERSFYNLGAAGDNCVTWAKRKFQIAGVDESRVLDSSSATLGSQKGVCQIL